MSQMNEQFAVPDAERIADLERQVFRWSNAAGWLVRALSQAHVAYYDRYGIHRLNPAWAAQAEQAQEYYDDANNCSDVPSPIVIEVEL